MVVFDYIEKNVDANDDCCVVLVKNIYEEVLL